MQSRAAAGVRVAEPVTLRFLQIFNLMKFDSYTRFLKSQLYQECVLAEVEGRGLPDAQQVPGSPVSKHSVGSDHSNVSTPKKVQPGPWPSLSPGGLFPGAGRATGTPWPAVSQRSVLWQLSGKSKSGRSLNEELGAEDSERRRRAVFFSWSKDRSATRSRKKRDPSTRPIGAWACACGHVRVSVSPRGCVCEGVCVPPGVCMFPRGLCIPCSAARLCRHRKSGGGLGSCRGAGRS